LAATVRVLIADDTADFRMLLRMALQRDALFEIVGEASDGSIAVDMAGDVDPDLVLLDLAMPVMDGLQALPLI
jgi:chemotaxis response regulator CheB